MKNLRAYLSPLIFIVSCTSAFAETNPGKVFARHPVWLKQGLTWEHVEGDTDPSQTFAGATILYFGKNGKFGMFGGIVLRHGSRMSLSEGDGGTAYSGTWTARDGIVHVNYRLVDSYKVAREVGKEPPQIPGPIQHAEVRLEDASGRKSAKVLSLQFDGNTYEVAPGFQVSELRSILEIFNTTSPASKGATLLPVK